MTGSNDTWFRKGESGNPAGRPKARPRPASAFGIILDRTLTITQGGNTREMTIDEALHYKTYQQAIAGSRMARRTLLKMIAKREKALAAKAPPFKPVVIMLEPTDPDNAFGALCLLGIATRDHSWGDEYPEVHLLLEPWAVQLALNRRAALRLDKRDVADVNRCTRNRQTLIWPRRFKP